MPQKDTIEVAELLARFAKMEEEARTNVFRAGELSGDEHGQRRFSEGELSALRGAQRMVRELAGWPIEERS